jgi:hypothetical protein
MHLRVSGRAAPAVTRPCDSCPRQDSNLRFRLRRPALYPLSYGGSRSGDGLPSIHPRAAIVAIVPRAECFTTPGRVTESPVAVEAASSRPADRHP